MKKLFFSILAMSFFLVSCSSEEAITNQNDTNSKMLKSFQITRNSDGSYALATSVADGVSTSFYDDAVTNNNEVHLFNGNDYSRSALTHNYDVINKQLSIAFINENDNSKPRITIYDNDTNLSTSRTEEDDLGLLNTYSITTNENGTVDLNFEVKEGVSVSFGYNNEEAINDIYLEEDTTATQQLYSANFTKEEDGTLRIDFVQPASTSSRESDRKRPRIIFNDPDM